MSEHFGNAVPSIDIGRTETNAVYGAVITVTIAATIAVILRFVARRKSEASISYDDYSIVLALVFLYGLNIDTVLAAALWGLGKDFFTLSTQQLLDFQKNGLASFALYFTTNATTKISLLLLYYRLFSPSRRFRIAIYAATIIVIAWWIAVFFANLFQCVPINVFWNYQTKNVTGAKCMNTVTFSIGTGISNLITDIMVLCLPMPMVWSLRTTRTQKITLTGIFLLGFCVCAISIIRIVTLVHPSHYNPTIGLTKPLIWSSVEPSVGIVSACLPIMRPLFGHWSLTLPSRSRSKTPNTAAKLATASSSSPVSAGLATPVKGHFTRLQGPTFRDQLEMSYRGSTGGPGTVVANGTYGDKRGTSWMMLGPVRGDGADGYGYGEGRMEEGRGPEVQMAEWPRRRDGAEWREALE